MPGTAPVPASTHSPAGRALSWAMPDEKRSISMSSPSSLSHPFSLAYQTRKASCSSSHAVRSLTGAAANAAQENVMKRTTAREPVSILNHRFIRNSFRYEVPVRTAKACFRGKHKEGRPLFPQKDKGYCSPLKVKPLFLEGKKEKVRPDKRDNAFIDKDRRIG